MIDHVQIELAAIPTNTLLHTLTQKRQWLITPLRFFIMDKFHMTSKYIIILQIFKPYN